MTKFQEIKERYLRNYVTDEQLNKYMELNVISSDERDEIVSSKEVGDELVQNE